MKNFEIIEPIKYGESVVSEVYKIQDADTKNIYVLKRVKGINNVLNLTLFKREVEALRKLSNCTNIVRLMNYDIEDIEGSQCGNIFLEYIQGKTLSDVDMSEYDKVQQYSMIRGILSAIKSAHQEGIIHRDINPNNIMITEDDCIKVIDFGISKIKDLVDNGTVYQFKTNYYSAPELGQNNENANEKSDIYSIGAVIYYLLSGKEPTPSNVLSQTISDEVGINPKIKQIISKMTAHNKEDRYDTIYDVIEEFNPVLDDLINTNNIYVFNIASGIIQDIFRKRLSPRRELNEMLNRNIPQNFENAYVYIENERGSYITHLIGKNYEFECEYNEDLQIYTVKKVFPIQPNIRANKKSRADKVCGKILFLDKNTSIENSNFKLYNSCIDTYEDYNSQTNINNEYNKKFAAWHKFLEILEDGVKKSAKRLPYKSLSYENNEIKLGVEASTYYEFDDVEPEATMIYETKKNRRDIIYEIGNYKTKYVDNDLYYVILNKYSKSAVQLPEKGVLCEDYRRNLSLIKREKNSLKEFNNSDVSTISQFKGIISEVKNAQSFNLNQDLEFYNKELDKYQQAAVKKALSTQDIALIQGPPGTGKTKVIIELIRQIIKINNQGKTFQQKILILSQAHTAVDNMLEDLAVCDVGNAQIIRIGKDEKLTELVKTRYAVDYAKERWISSIIEKSKEQITSELKALSINEHEFYEYSDAHAKSQSHNLSSKEENKTNKTITIFETKYSELIKTKKFKSVLLATEWVNRIFNSEELPTYFIRNSVVVSGTCTGFLANSAIHDMTFDYVIIDEAAKATFPELIISFIKAKKIILVGDHMQLPPILEEDTIKKNERVFRDSDLDTSTLYTTIFERLFDYLPDSNKQRLNMQYRMHPVIGDMVSKIFYNNTVDTGCKESDKTHQIKKYQGCAIVWLNTANCKNKWERKIEHTTTFMNNLEVQIIKDQLRLIDESMNENNYDIGIITPYSGQKEAIRKQIKNMSFTNITEQIPVNSVDAFQGGQKDIVIYSTVRSNRQKNSGFATKKERVNVSFSRAKRLLIIVGDMNQVDNFNNDNRFPEIIEYMKNNQETCKIIDYSKK